MVDAQDAWKQLSKRTPSGCVPYASGVNSFFADAVALVSSYNPPSILVYPVLVLVCKVQMFLLLNSF